MNQYKRFILPTIILAGAAIRLFNITRESLWYDELFPLWASKLPLDELLVEVPASRHPPFYYLIGHVWFSLGSSDFWIRMISWAAGVTTIWLVFLVGKELFSQRTGLWAAALAAASSYLFWYSREASDYALLIALLTASLLFLIRSYNRGGWVNWVSYVAITVAAVFTHYYAIFLIPAQAAFFLISYGWRNHRLKPWLTSEVVILVSLIPWMFINSGTAGWIVLNAPGIKLLFYGIFERSFFLLIGSIMPLNHMEVTVPSGWIIYRFAQIATLIAFNGLLFFSQKFRQSFMNRRTLGLAVLLILLITGPVISQILRDYFLSVRFYSLAIIPFILLLAIFITCAPRKLGTIFGVLVLAVFLYNTAWTYGNYRYDNWRDTLSIISNNQKPDDKLMCFPLTECTVAVKHYLPDIESFSGGMVFVNETGSLAFLPYGREWAGYRTRGFTHLSGMDLEDRLNLELKGVNRIWVLSGDDSAGDIGRADEVYYFLDRGWTEKGRWEILPLVLSLHERI